MNETKHRFTESTILVVDDNQETLRVITLILRRNGYHVQPVSSGKLALELVDKIKIDLILLDIMMPTMSGYQVCKQLKTNEKTRDIPVIFISHLDGVWDKVTAFELGGVDYITNPFDTPELIARIETHLRLRSLQQQLQQTVQDLSKANNIETHRITTLNPYIVGRTLTESDVFFGRKQIINNILQAVFNNHVAIAGPRRSGKSSLLMQLKEYIKELNNKETYFCPIFFDLQAVNQTEFFNKLMRAMLKTLKENYPHLVLAELIYNPKVASYDNHDFEDDLHEILTGLAQLMPQEIKFILLVDEGDKINEYDLTIQGKIRGLLSHNQCLKMVWTGVNILAMANQASSPWYNMQISYTLPPLDETEAKQLIIEPAQRLGYIYQVEAQERILSYAKGQPYIIQYLCYRAVEEMLKEQRRSGKIILADVEIAITALAQELVSQDKDNVVYQNIQEQQDVS